MSNYVQNVLVKYGDFTFPAPTPFVSKTFDNEFVGGNLWSTRVSITLNGKIALLPKDSEGSGNNYLELQAKRDKVAAAFAGALGKNFLDFSVIGGGADFLLKNCTVDSVSFSESKYVGVVEYSIAISGFKNDKDFYSANYGVTQPVDSWQYTEAGGVVSATHNVSATGTNTSSGGLNNAFSNAKSFVDGRKGTSKKVNSILIKNVHPNSSMILTSSNETVDRLGGRYSITEVYSFHNNESSLAKGEEANLPAIQTEGCTINYSASFDVDQQAGFITVNLSGQILGSKDSSVTWEQIKSDLKSRDFYQLANKAYKRYIKGTGGLRAGTPYNSELIKTPVTFGISPNEDAKTISFQVSYDNNELFSTAKIRNADSYFNYNLNFSHDNVSDIITVQCGGSILTRGALHKRNRDGKVLLDLMLADNHKLVRDEAQRYYYKMFPERVQYVLSPRANSLSVSQDKFNGTVSYSATFSDQDFPENSKLNNLSYSISVDPPLQSYVSVPSCLRNGHSLIYNLELKKKREHTDINTAANAEERAQNSINEARDEIKSISDSLVTSFVDGDVKRLVSENKVENKQISNITYNRTFSHEKVPDNVELNRLDN